MGGISLETCGANTKYVTIIIDGDIQKSYNRFQNKGKENPCGTDLGNNTRAQCPRCF